MSIRFFIVGSAEAGRPVGACLSERLSLPRSVARRILREGLVRVNGAPCDDPHRRLQRGQRVQVRAAKSSASSKGKRAATERGKKPKARTPRAPKGPRPTIRYADKHLVVVDKPAGITTVRHAEEKAEFGKRAQRFLPPTLAELLPDLLARRSPDQKTPVRAVHRLDKETSGLVVFARNVEAERHLGKQFRAHSIERQYLAVVRGQAKEGRIESQLVRDRGDGRRGTPPAAREDDEGQRAVTHVRVVETLGDFTLVECRLETGRTHQVRIHLGEAGTPLCGERIYDRPLHGKPLPDDSGMTRIALHAALLGFAHPLTGERMCWSSSLPRDMAALVERLRRHQADPRSTS